MHTHPMFEGPDGAGRFDPFSNQAAATALGAVALLARFRIQRGPVESVAEQRSASRRTR
jgi:hypothetical protein